MRPKQPKVPFILAAGSPVLQPFPNKHKIFILCTRILRISKLVFTSSPVLQPFPNKQKIFILCTRILLISKLVFTGSPVPQPFPNKQKIFSVRTRILRISKLVFCWLASAVAFSKQTEDIYFTDKDFRNLQAHFSHEQNHCEMLCTQQ